jgi:N-acetylmuramoyl-L-alanine amidase
MATLLAIASLTSPVTAEETRPIQLVVGSETHELAALDVNDITYFSLSELAEIIGGQLNWELLGHKISYINQNARFDFVVGSPFFKLGDKLYNQTFPARLENAQLFLPAKTFLSFLDGVLPQKISYFNENRTLRVDSEYFNVSDLSVEGKANGLLIEVLLTGKLDYEIFLTEGNWLNITITDARINASQILARKDQRYMYKLTTHQSAGAGQISMRLKRNVTTWHHKLAYDPPRIQITISDANFAIDPQDTAPVVIGPDNKIDVIVIDAGHGGSDYGAIGQGRAREKEVVLEIARKLAKLIRKDKQFKVVMTRDRDKYVSLEERARIANEAGADLFISIHANASPKKKVRGWNVFFLAPARNDSARAVAQFENSFFLREKNGETDSEIDSSEELDQDPVMTVLNEMIMTEFQDESHDFAMMTAREFHRKLKIPARGVDQAAFFVLNEIFTPSVLIEIGFISNKKEEKILKGDKYQKAVTQSLFSAIKKFKAKYEEN